VNGLAARGLLGQGLAENATGYSVVYHIEIALLFATLIALGPLVRSSPRAHPHSRFSQLSPQQP
jgi:BCD family chlorophyll transporter-like MFS transporter